MEARQGRTEKSQISWHHVILASFLSLFLLLIPPGTLALFPVLLLLERYGVRAACYGLGAVWGISLGRWLFFLWPALEASIWGEALQLTVLSLSGLLFGWHYHRTRELTSSGALGILPGVLLATAVLAFLLLSEGASLEPLWTEQVRNILAEVLRQSELTVAWRSEEKLQVDALVAFLSDNAMWILYLLPGMSGLVMTVSLWLNVLLLRLAGSGGSKLPPLKGWRPPEAWIWVFIVGAAASLSGYAPLLALGLNVLLIGMGVYFLAGVSLVAYGAAVLGVPSFLTAFLVLSATFLGGGPLLVLLGLIDFWLNLRARWPLP